MFNESAQFVALVSHANHSVVWLCLQLVQTPRLQDPLIFVLMTDGQTDDRLTKMITLPLAHARRVIIIIL